MLPPLVGGALFQLVSISAPFWAWSVLLGLLIVVALRALKRGGEQLTASTA